MTYRGDIRLEDTIDVKFTTRRFSTGAPFTLAGTPAVSAYVGNSTTEITAGITLTVDFDTRTGLNNVRVVATAANGYTAGSNVDLVITTGTVDSVSVVGEVVGSFSIENRSALMPTTVGRKLDVSAGGEAGLDWANIGSPTTAQNLSATNIDVDQIVASVSGAVGSVTGAVGSVTGAVGSVTAAVTVGTNNDKTGYGLSAAAVQAVWDALTTALTTVGSIGKLLVDNINATISSRLATAGYTTPLDAAGTRTAVGLAAANLDTQIGTLATAATATAIKAKTDPLTFTVAGQVDANMQSVNDTQLQGTGAVGTDEWRKV